MFFQQMSLEFHTLWDSAGRETGAIPKPQVYLLPRAIWMLTDSSNWTYRRIEMPSLSHPTKAWLHRLVYNIQRAKTAAVMM